MLEGKDKIIGLITVMDVLLDLINGSSFETTEDELEFRQLVIDIGYDHFKLESETLLETLQAICKEFSDIDLSQYKEDDLYEEYDSVTE